MSERQDTASAKRIELHLHTRFSTMDALIDPEALVQRAAEWGMDAVAVTDAGSAHAFPYLWRAGKKYGVKIIYGVETIITNGANKEYPVCLLAKNRAGLKRLYELISLSYDHYRHHLPTVPQSELLARREGLLVGAIDKKDAEQAPELFDYIEIRPTDAETAGLEIARTAKRLGKPLAAVSDARFLEPEDELAHRILLSAQKNGGNVKSTPLYLRSTDEMLAQLSYLGDDDCRLAVIDNPRALAAQCEEIELIPDKLPLPTFDGSADELKAAVYGRLAALYGENPPAPIRERADREMNAILSRGYEGLFAAAARIARQSRENGYMLAPRNEIGASFAAYLAGITEINPLPAHYRCPKCVYTELAPESRCGADLPDKCCPDCGTPMDRDGFDIPSAIASAVFQSGRAMQIILNCASEYSLNAATHIEKIFGAEHVFRVGRVGFLLEKSAASLVDRFCERQDMQLPEQERQRIIRLCVGAKRDFGEKPYSLFIAPQDMSAADFCPTLRFERDDRGEHAAAQFECGFLQSYLPRIDIVTYDAFDELYAMENAANASLSSIPLNDPAVLSRLFSEAFWDDLEQMPDMRVPRLCGEMMRQLLRETHPKDFDDLVRLFGLSRSTNGWRGNAETLIREGAATLKEVITCREDILRDLTARNVPYDIACEIMSAAGKGQIEAGKIPLRWGEEMHRTRTPPWYVRSMINAGYYFSRAQAVCDALAIYRIAWGLQYCPPNDI